MTDPAAILAAFDAAIAPLEAAAAAAAAALAESVGLRAELLVPDGQLPPRAARRASTRLLLPRLGLGRGRTLEFGLALGNVVQQ